jgi:hypothetical protein
LSLGSFGTSETLEIFKNTSSLQSLVLSRIKVEATLRVFADAMQLGHLVPR